MTNLLSRACVIAVAALIAVNSAVSAAPRGRHASTFPKTCGNVIKFTSGKSFSQAYQLLNNPAGSVTVETQAGSAIKTIVVSREVEEIFIKSGNEDQVSVVCLDKNGKGHTTRLPNVPTESTTGS